MAVFDFNNTKHQMFTYYDKVLSLT